MRAVEALMANSRKVSAVAVNEQHMANFDLSAQGMMDNSKIIIAAVSALDLANISDRNRTGEIPRPAS